MATTGRKRRFATPAATCWPRSSRSHSNSQSWTYVTFDLTPYKGQTVQLYFNVHEDGDSYGYLTYMYLDDIAIVRRCAAAALRASHAVPRGRHAQCFAAPSEARRSAEAPHATSAIPQGSCGIPATARAYALNATVVPHGPLSYLTIWPTGATRPVVSTLNSLDGRIKANAAIIPAGTSQAVSVYASNTTDVVLDISGYFVQDSSALRFLPADPLPRGRHP